MVSGIARNKTEKEKTHFLEAWSLGGDRGGRYQSLIREKRKISNINPIPAEVLENQDMLGGGQFDPPL